MTETTDGVQELNEQDLQKVTGGLGQRPVNGTVNDYEQYKLKRQESYDHHYKQAWVAGSKDDWATTQKELRAAVKSRGNMDWADNKIAKKQGR